MLAPTSKLQITCDILTKPFTSIEKGSKALELTSVGDFKSSARTSGVASAAPPVHPSAAAARPLNDGLNRLIIEVCCSADLFGQMAGKEFKACHVAFITEMRTEQDRNQK